jgi:hypothetical protein
MQLRSFRTSSVTLGSTFIASALGAALCAPLAAQGAHPVTTVRPAPVATTEHRMTTPPATRQQQGSVAQLMPQSGLYILTMTATKINGRPAASTPAMSEPVSMSWSGNTFAIIAADQTLHGQVTNNHLSASSNDAGGTLTLSGTPSARSATGTFTLTQTHGASASGGFTLTPPGQQHTMKKNDPYNSPRPPSGPCGFWCQVMAWLA